MPDWNQKKEAGEGGEFGGGLPQAKYTTESGEEVHLSQFGSILRHFGMRYGYFDASDYQQSKFIDPLVDTFADIINSLAKFMFAPEEEQGPLKESYIELAKKFHALVESNLNAHSGKFAAGEKVTIADFVMASYVGNYLINTAFPASSEAMATVGDTPKFEAYMQTVQDEFTYLKTRPTPGAM